MNIKKHYDGIYEIENFLTQSQINLFLSEAKNDKKWQKKSKGNIVKEVSPKAFEEIVKIFDKTSSLFSNVKRISYSNTIRKLSNEEFMWPHLDSGYDKESSKIVFGVVIYLNNDFKGGELIYPEIGLSLTPKPGNMVFHDAKIKHQVFPTFSGERYSITTFIFGDGTTKFIH